MIELFVVLIERLNEQMLALTYAQRSIELRVAFGRQPGQRILATAINFQIIAKRFRANVARKPAAARLREG